MSPMPCTVVYVALTKRPTRKERRAHMRIYLLQRKYRRHFMSDGRCQREL